MVEDLALGGVMSLGGHVRWNIIFVLWRATWQALYKGELWFPSILSLSQLIVTTPGLDQLCWPPLFCTRNSPCSAVLYQEWPMLHFYAHKYPPTFGTATRTPPPHGLSEELPLFLDNPNPHRSLPHCTSRQCLEVALGGRITEFEKWKSP